MEGGLFDFEGQYGDDYEAVADTDGVRQDNVTMATAPLYDEGPPQAPDWSSPVASTGNITLQYTMHHQSFAQMPTSTAAVAYQQYSMPVMATTHYDPYGAGAVPTSQSQQAMLPTTWSQQPPPVLSQSHGHADAGMRQWPQGSLLDEEDDGYIDFDGGDPLAADLHGYVQAYPQQNQAGSVDNTSQDNKNNIDKGKTHNKPKHKEKIKEENAKEKHREKDKDTKKKNSRDKGKAKNKDRERDDPKDKKLKRSSKETAKASSPSPSSSKPASDHRRLSHSAAAPADEDSIVATWPGASGTIPTATNTASSRSRKRSAYGPPPIDEEPSFSSPINSNSIASPPGLTNSEASTPYTGFQPPYLAYPGPPSTGATTTASSPDFECLLPSPVLSSPRPGQSSTSRTSAGPSTSTSVGPPMSYHPLLHQHNHPDQQYRAGGSSGGGGGGGEAAAPGAKGQRARNRLAATKCRAKTKATISKREEDERAISRQHDMLQAYADALREEAWMLKNELLRHSSGGCSCVLIQQYVANTAQLISEEAAERKVARTGSGDGAAGGGGGVTAQRVDAGGGGGGSARRYSQAAIGQMGHEREQERLAQLRRLSGVARIMGAIHPGGGGGGGGGNDDDDVLEDDDEGLEEEDDDDDEADME